MNWITNYVRPRINSIFSRREMPENLWQKCDECGTMLFHRELSDNLNVCTNCGHHMAISPRARFKALFDGGLVIQTSFQSRIRSEADFLPATAEKDGVTYAARKPSASRTIWVSLVENVASSRHWPEPMASAVRNSGTPASLTSSAARLLCPMVPISPASSPSRLRDSS